MKVAATECVRTAIAAVRARADAASNPAAVRRVLDTAEALMTGRLGDGTFDAASRAREATTRDHDAITHAAWWVSIAALGYRDGAVDAVDECVIRARECLAVAEVRVAS